MTKVDEALAVIADCEGPKGFYASTDTYRGEYWTRDLSFCIDVLLDLGYSNIVRRHVAEIESRRPMTPLFFVDSWGDWMASSAHKIAWVRGIDGVRALRFASFGTADSPLHAGLLAQAMYRAVSKARRGPVIGGDWRDLAYELHGTALLSNRCLLYRLCGAEPEMPIAPFDALGFDLLGASMAVLWDLPNLSVHREDFERASAPYGLRATTKSRWPSPIARVNHYGTVWPFASYLGVMALRKMGLSGLADDEMGKLVRLEGFNEWYEPRTGAPMGSRGQLWSACAYLRAVGYAGN